MKRTAIVLSAVLVAAGVAAATGVSPSAASWAGPAAPSIVQPTPIS